MGRVCMKSEVKKMNGCRGKRKEGKGTVKGRKESMSPVNLSSE